MSIFYNFLAIFWVFSRILKIIINNSAYKRIPIGHNINTAKHVHIFSHWVSIAIATIGQAIIQINIEILIIQGSSINSKLKNLSQNDVVSFPAIFLMIKNKINFYIIMLFDFSRLYNY